MKHYLKHKGYYGEIYYCEEDGIYVGVVLGICSMLAVHEDTFSDTLKELVEAIDDYLEICAEEGLEPNPTDPKVAREMEALLGKNDEGDFHIIENRRSLAFAQ